MLETLKTTISELFSLDAALLFFQHVGFYFFLIVILYSLFLHLRRPINSIPGQKSLIKNETTKSIHLLRLLENKRAELRVALRLDPLKDTKVGTSKTEKPTK